MLISQGYDSSTFYNAITVVDRLAIVISAEENTYMVM